ncbi:ATP-grasp domain-containing protein [Caminibacter pacificus]|uniref:Carbamoyl-phosphate synthase large subunit n=1 Tax=Caminibacter pacificus TaxID=1424653 RepID=A0AAJ4RC41_9BACT|nr:ATP-grasp domain-containing protein [Caminibacter pacificus]NPA87331.1 carboxylate--amine ligase [Campylobacterota bacterium]QCI28032.1 carboxylate--amine ligase [Caminibacter pacificus]ROR39780.1 carbamoyl-phosphate synthase large subunit [Caminibacter pacificus]
MKIALSGLNNTDNPAPGVPVAKSLSEYDLIGLSYDPNEPGIYQGLFEKVYLMPFPSVGWEDTKQRLNQIKEKSGLDILIPNLDAELPMYIKYQNELEKMGIKTFLPTLENFEMREKKRLPEFSEKLGVKHPKTIEIISLDDLIKATKEIGFPVMVKGNYYKAYIAYNLDEAIEYYYKISNEWGFPLLVQEVVSGIEINYVGLANAELLGGVGIKKLTTTDLGKVWSAVSIKNEKLLEMAKKFVEVTGWRGAFELEAIANGNDVYLIEINPRFPAWVYFATMLGINLPKMMVDIIKGEKVTPNLEYPVEKMYVRYVEETVRDFSDFSKLLSTKEL